jgi:hypothetical protein
MMTKLQRVTALTALGSAIFFGAQLAMANIPPNDNHSQKASSSNDRHPDSGRSASGAGNGGGGP